MQVMDTSVANVWNGTRQLVALTFWFELAALRRGAAAQSVVKKKEQSQSKNPCDNQKQKAK